MIATVDDVVELEPTGEAAQGVQEWGAFPPWPFKPEGIALDGARDPQSLVCSLRVNSVEQLAVPNCPAMMFHNWIDLEVAHAALQQKRGAQLNIALRFCADTPNLLLCISTLGPGQLLAMSTRGHVGRVFIWGQR